MELDVPDLDSERHFYYEVLEAKPFTYTTEDSRVRIQINLFMTLWKNKGQLRAVEDYWMQVGIASGHSSSIADFNWSPAHISVSNFWISFGTFFNCGVLSYGQFLGTKIIVCPSFCFCWEMDGV